MNVSHLTSEELITLRDATQPLNRHPAFVRIYLAVSIELMARMYDITHVNMWI